MSTLSKTFDGILREWGHNIVLQRKDAEGNFTRALERHTVRHMYPATRGLPKTREERPEGVTTEVDLIYFFRAEAKPREGDRIYDQDPTGQSTYIIDYSLPMRGYGGKVVFYTVGVTRETPN